MRIPAWALLSAASALLLAVACGSDEHASPGLLPGSAGDAGEGGEASGATSSLGGSTAASSGSANAGRAGTQELGGTGAMIEPVSLTLSVFNVVQRQVVPGQDPTTGVLERIDLPPWITFLANVPDDTESVEFTIDDVVRVDNLGPFLMHEDGFGRGRWEPTAGEHVLTAKAFAKLDAQGELLAATTQTITYNETGVAADFQPLSEAETQSWVEAHLDEVMQPKTFKGALGDTLPYRLFVPEAYDETVKYPLLVFLHDYAQRGDDNGSAIYDSELFHGPRSIVAPNGQHEFPAIVLVPQCPAVPNYHEWSHWYGATEEDPQAGLDFATGHYPSHEEPSIAAGLLHQLVLSLLTTHSIDFTRIYLVGESMGGQGVWDITWRWPETWAAAVPIMGYTDTTRAKLLLDIPFWSFHSTLDTEHNVIGALNMVDKLKVLGGVVYYTQYQDVDHAHTAAKVWAEPELLPWIWSQRRRVLSK